MNTKQKVLLIFKALLARIFMQFILITNISFVISHFRKSAQQQQQKKKKKKKKKIDFG